MRTRNVPSSDWTLNNDLNFLCINFCNISAPSCSAQAPPFWASVLLGIPASPSFFFSNIIPLENPIWAFFLSCQIQIAITGPRIAVPRDCSTFSSPMWGPCFAVIFVSVSLNIIFSLTETQVSEASDSNLHFIPSYFFYSKLWSKARCCVYALMPIIYTKTFSNIWLRFRCHYRYHKIYLGQQYCYFCI